MGVNLLLERSIFKAFPFFRIPEVRSENHFFSKCRKMPPKICLCYVYVFFILIWREISLYTNTI